jgi:hypothetical protein
MKNLGKIKDLLSREEMKQIQGGSGGSCYVTCNGQAGSTYGTPNCNRAADNACGWSSWTWCSCW